MTERYRRTDFGHLEISITFQDPGAYSKAWTVPLRAQLAADTELLESVCNENDDNGQQHWVGKASDAARSAVKVAPEILAKYLGGTLEGEGRLCPNGAANRGVRASPAASALHPECSESSAPHPKGTPAHGRMRGIGSHAKDKADRRKPGF